MVKLITAIIHLHWFIFYLLFFKNQRVNGFDDVSIYLDS